MIPVVSHPIPMQEEETGGAEETAAAVVAPQTESSNAQVDDGGIDFGDDDDDGNEIDEEHVKRSVKRLRDESDDEREGGGSDLEDSDEGSKDEDVEDDSSGNGSVVFSEDDEEEGDDTEKNKKSKSKTNKKEKRERKKSREDESKKSKKKSKRDFRSLLDIGPDSDDDDEEDDEIAEEEDEFEAGDEEDYLAARAAADEAVKLRHERNSEMMNRSVHDIAAEFERKAQADLIRKQLSQGELGIAGEGVYGKTKSNPVLQQALLPTINDKIFRVKVASGKEMLLCRSILLKCQDYKRRGIPSGIKSVFSTSTKGYIYIEALAEPYAKEIIQKLIGIFAYKFAKVSVPEMQTLLNVQVTKKPLKLGQFVRIKRGVLKGDIVQICELFEGGTKAMIKAVPRPDYTKKSDSNTTSAKTARPPQRLFNAEEAQGSDDYRRSRHPRDRSGPWYDFWNGEYYKDGFLHKEVTCNTYITANNIEPRLDELQLFMSHDEQQKKQDRAQKKRERKERLESRDDDDDSDVMSDDYVDGDSDINGADTGNKGQSVLRELVKQLQDSSNDDGKAVPFIVGDLVQVNGGEVNNMVGKILSIDEINRTCEIMPMSSVLTTKLSIETSLLVKYITPGYHIKVNNGPFMGQTGRVVSVQKENGEQIAAILTDGVNSEIMVNVGMLQVSDEVNTGNDSLNGYELYDLVVLNENESAVVINVGKEKLRIINNMDIVKEVLPLELQGKRNNISSKSKAFDSQQGELSVNDSVNVTGGPHLGKKSCTVKHIMKGVLWLHLSSYLKNSGIFVVRARNCIIAGTTLGVVRTTASVGSFKASYGPGRGKDPAIGRTCTVTKGPHKGFDGRISAATKDTYTLSISAKLKTVTLPRSIVRLNSDNTNNMMNGRSDNSYFDPTATPAFVAETPSYLGAQTPMLLGSETPLNFDGSMTPSQFGSRTPSQYRRDDDDIWMPNARDDAYDSKYNDNVIVVTYKDWVEKMVVVVSHGRHMGKYAVLQGRPTAEGIFKIMLYDDRGKIVGGVIDLHYSEMTPVDKIPKYENVAVIVGNSKGMRGMFEEYHGNGNDALLLVNNNIELHKRNTIAWIHKEI